MVNNIIKNKLPFDKVFNNAKKLGLPSYISGFNWTAIIDLEDHIIKEGCTDEKEILNELENYLIELQNKNYANNVGYFKKIKELKKIKEFNKQQKIHEIQSEVDSNNDSIKKKKKKNKKNSKNIKDEIDLAIKEIYEDENTETKIKLREKAEEKADRLERIKYKKMIKNLDKRVEDPSGNGELDIIQANMNTKNDAIHEYFFHLREEFYKQHNKDTMFNNALIYLIKKNKEQFNKISIITKCINVFFYEKFNVFKLYVYGDDPNNYSKIINATILISNLIHKLRTKLSNGKEFIRKAALAM